MIQDIYPSKLDNSFKVRSPQPEDTVFVFDDEGRAAAKTEGTGLLFPTVAQTKDSDVLYLFSIDGTGCFLSQDAGNVPEGFDLYPIRKLRDEGSGKELFAAFTAYHLWKWYSDNRLCPKCGEPLVHDKEERALSCGKCGNIIYPRINPAVIVGVINNDSLLITRYRRGYSHNALIAGFCEIGETLEETVQREVMEEAGIKVKNIRYYRSQPWGMAQDLLVGFFCEVDGDDHIHMDEGELKSAGWTEREDIELQPNNLSLTNEMMRMFKENRV